MSHYSINMSESKSNALEVKEFTEGALGKSVPEFPKVMTKDRVGFIIRMVISELDELACTVCKDKEEVSAFMQELLETRDQCSEFLYPDEVHRVAAQGDAMVDAMYYMYDTAARHGLNLSKIFDEVHAANMNKRDPETGKFKRRADGKILKPENWKSPDVDNVVKDQFVSGSWT